MMNKQKKYSRDFSFQIAERVKSGELINKYLNKDYFDTSGFLKNGDDITESSFQQIDHNLCEKMLSAPTEFDQGKILFETLRHLNLRDASDIGFWNYLAHNDLYPYIHLRWPDIENPPKGSNRVNYILNHWVMVSSSQNNLIDYTLSGLWWSFFISQDEGRDDPYELTRILFKNQSLRTKGFGQAKFARHKAAVIGILEFIKESKLDDTNLEDNGRAITPFINLIGGTKPLAFFDKEWFKTQLNEKFKSDINAFGRLYRRDEKPPVPETKKETTAAKLLREKEDAEKTTTESNTETVENNKLVVSLLNDGSLVRNDSQWENSKVSITINNGNMDGYLLLFLKDGRAAKIIVSSLFDTPAGYPMELNGFIGADFIMMAYIEKESLLFLTSQHPEILGYKLAKAYKTSWIAESNINAPVVIKVTNYTKDLGIKILPAEIEEEIKRIIKQRVDDFVVAGANHFKKEWGAIERID